MHLCKKVTISLNNLDQEYYMLATHFELQHAFMELSARAMFIDKHMSFD